MTQTHLPLPASDASFMATLGAFLTGEDAARFVDQFQPFVVTGGLHATGGGLTGTPAPLVAYCLGEYITESGAITYPNGATIWVIADEDTAGNKLTFTRVAGTHYLIDTASVSQPTAPDGAVFLMRVTTAGGAITAVQDLRPMSPVRRLANSGIIFSSAYPSLQAAIDALPAHGGTVYIEPGTYTLTATLTLGNGAASTVSTKQGIYLKGLGAPFSSEFGYTDEPAVKLVWAGGADPVVAIKGPLAGWGLQNIAIDGAGDADYGILVTSAQYGDVRNVNVRGCQVAGIGSTTVTTFSGAANTSSFHNKWTNIFIDASGSFGIELTGGAPLSNTSYNTFDNVLIAVTGNGIGLQLGACSNNVFLNLHFSLGAGAAAPINLAYDNGQSDLWPATNVFYGVDLHDKMMTQTGAAGPALGANLMLGISTVNSGALIPEIEGLIALYTDDDGNFNFLPAFIDANAKPNGDVVITSTPGHVHNLVPGRDEVADVGGGTGFQWRLGWIAGGVATKVVATTSAAYTVTEADGTVLGDTTGGNVGIQLPPAADMPGKVFFFKKVDASANDVIIVPDGAETIDGAASLSLTTQWQTAHLQSTGDDWVRLDTP